MINIKKYKGMVKAAAMLLTFQASMFTLSSCQDFLDVDSTHVIDAGTSHLNNATDTVYSVTGILYKLQAIGDRTILLGEARGDLMDVTSYTKSDLRDVAMFQVDDNNKYNSPVDYYAVINNCNYFIAKADTALKNNRNEYIFKAEYAAVKAIRAWTYLQLVTTYGQVPFVVEPVLTKEEGEKDYPMYDIKQVCDYFINEDGLQDLVDQYYPQYDAIKGIPSRLFYFPVRLVLGDLNLWAGNYFDAAKCYHDYLNRRNGENTIYPITTSAIKWKNNSWKESDGSWLSSSFPTKETNSATSEIISIIPTDSIPSEGNYSELRGIFNTLYNDDNQVSLVPSQNMFDISAAQKYCYNEEGDFQYAPTGLDKNMTGDLRLSKAYFKYDNATSYGERIPVQQIQKYTSRNIRVYRRTLVYQRLAEAINRAGYPHYAFHLLATGVNHEMLTDSICKNYDEEDSLKILANFDFRGSLTSNASTNYVINTDPKRENDSKFTANTIGLHSRGSGYTPGNAYYRMPEGSKEEMIKAVEDMIVTEGALEFAFEGYRYYDLLRVALRRQAEDPNYLSDKIKARRGAGKDSGIATDLTDKKNWFLNYQGKIGYGK